jgi:hypothetical protein
MKKLVSRTSPSMAVALIALFVSLGGVSWAVATGSIGSKALKDNSIQGRDVRDETLESRDLVNGALQSRDVRDGALRGVDVNDRSIGGVDLASNTLGDREIDETKLDINRLGGVGSGRFVNRVRRVQTQTGNDPATPKAAPVARCPRRTRLLGGGTRIVAPLGTPVAITVNGPRGRNGWEAAAYATAATGNWQLVAYAICG